MNAARTRRPTPLVARNRSAHRKSLTALAIQLAIHVALSPGVTSAGPLSPNADRGGTEGNGASTPTSIRSATSPPLPAVFEKVAPSVVGLTCRRGNTEFYFGTGTLLDPAGLVLTSTTVVPRDGVDLLIYLQGSRVVRGRLIETVDSLELALLRVEAAGDVGPLPYVRLGRSNSVRLGDLALTFGNSFRSIQTDDQVSLGKGIVSGFYDLTETYSQSKYTGTAIETTAPLNSGTDGGPLIDMRGRLIGLLSLNYSRSRWLGTAVPVDLLKPTLWKHLGVFDDEETQYRASIGLSLEERTSGDIRVLKVKPRSPAATAGLSPGDRLLEMEGKHLPSLPAFRKAFRNVEPGNSLALKVSRKGKTRRVKLSTWGRF